jgi:hypothetical protein
MAAPEKDTAAIAEARTVFFMLRLPICVNSGFRRAQIPIFRGSASTARTTGFVIGMACQNKADIFYSCPTGHCRVLSLNHLQGFLKALHDCSVLIHYLCICKFLMAIF